MCIKDVASQAMYEPQLVDCAKHLPGIGEFFQLLYVFLSFKSSRPMFLILHPDKQTRQIQHLSDTRWACRFDTIRSTFDSIIATFESIGQRQG